MTTERIDINPEIMMEKPVIRGTRITVELILRKLAEGAGERELLGGLSTPHNRRHPRRSGLWSGKCSARGGGFSPKPTASKQLL